MSTLQEALQEVQITQWINVYIHITHHENKYTLRYALLLYIIWH